MALLDKIVDGALDYHAERVACAFKADVFAYIGGIDSAYLQIFRTKIEELASNEQRSKNLAFLLYTGGGEVEFVEKMVQIIRHHYEEIWFIVPDIAMSAGTILCMSGDKIYMDYSSALGPIDPQVRNREGMFVPALGYLDQVERYIEKAEKGTLTDAEFAILQSQDIAQLRRYEQARDLSISLLKEWLTNYKFKFWTTHSSTGQLVTPEEKTKRAEEIAADLSDHKKWHSHGRMIGIQTLTKDLRLQIEDYSNTEALKDPIRVYSDILLDCAKSRKLSYFFHSASFSEISCVEGENV